MTSVPNTTDEQRSGGRRHIRSLLKSGPAAIAAGLMVLGASSYGFLLVAGQVLGDKAYAPFGTLWVLVFLLAPAFFFPIEQEVGRAVSSRRARNLGVMPVFKRAAFLASVMAIALVVLTLALSPLFVSKLFNDEWVLLVGLVISFGAFAGEYLLKGLLAGSGRLHRYGELIAIEGTVRVVVALAFAFTALHSVTPFALVIGLASLVAVIVVAPAAPSLLDDGPEASLRELSTSLGNLVTASLFSQILINAAPLVVKYQAGPSQQALAGAFVKAVVITRIPVFLFQAVQAVLLPRLTRLATTGQHGAYRKTLLLTLGLVAGIGLIGTVGAAILGDDLLRLFGSSYNLPRGDLVLLALGSAIFLLCMTLAQALVSVNAQSKTVIGWGAGVIGFGLTYLIPAGILVQSELALIIGASIAFLMLGVLLTLRLRRIEGNAESLIDAMSPSQEIIEI